MNQILRTWMSAKAAPAARLRAYIDAMAFPPGAAPAVIRMKVWIGEEGRVSRIGAPGFAVPQAHEDLHALIIGQRLPKPPPPGML